MISRLTCNQSKSFTKRDFFVYARAGAVCAALFLHSTSSAQMVQRQALTGHVPAISSSLRSTERVAGATHLNLAIGLPLRNQRALTNFLQQIYDPKSVQFHHFLTSAQFTERFGPTEKDYQALITFAKVSGWTVTGTHPNRTLLDVSASVSSIEKVLQVKMQVYQHPKEARKFYAPSTEPSLNLLLPVLHISGLDNFVVPHPMHLRITPFNQALNAAPNGTGSGTGGTFMGNDFRAAYVPGVSVTGIGQTVGLLEFDSGFYPNDITTYETRAGLPNVPVQAVLLDGYGGAAGYANDEVSLDIEMAISLAPGLSKVLVYEGSSTDDILNRMATDNLAKQLSASWTYPIDANSDQIFLQYAAQGQTFFNASGDSDAYTGSVPPPTDDPNITIVGGTTLTTSGPGGGWLSETVWNWGNGIGSSGGISTSKSIPTWQQGVSMSSNGGSTMFRNLPDVALTADNVFVIYGNGNSGNFGGTSCAAPLWAAFMALVNQQAAGNGSPMAGFINPAVYALGKGSSYTSVFHDITTGNNTRAGSSAKFFGVAGYDLCTGWGTPNGNNMINALAGPPVPTPPSITTQPLSQTVPTAGAAFFTVSVSGSFPLGYQWSFNTTNIPGATDGSLTLTNVMQAQSGNYAVLVTNAYGSTNSSNAVLTVNPPIPPSITAQPLDHMVTVGNNGTFAVTATGTPPLSYQWQINSNNINGATNAALTLVGVQFTDAGTYSVLVTSPYGSTNSSNAVLTVHPAICSPPPSGLVSWWPGNGNTGDLAGGNNGTLQGSVTYVTGQVGQAFSFNGNGQGVLVGNATNLQLQNFTIEAWIRRGSTTQASLTAGGGVVFGFGAGGYQLGLFDNGQIFLVAVNLAYVGSSTNVTDTNWHHVAVTKNGSVVVFYLDGVGYPAPAYNQVFQFSSTAAIGIGSKNLANSFLGSIDEVDMFNRSLAASEVQAIYNAGTSGKCASSPPSITTQPANQSATLGNHALFSVSAGGLQPLNYQWQLNSVNISGATNSGLTLIDVQYANEGNYSVTISNAFGSVVSSNAFLTVNPAACATPPSGLVSWWPGNSSTVDLVGGNDGTLQGNVVYVPGLVGQAFSLNGNAEGVVVGNPANLQLQTFSIDAWIQRSSATHASVSTSGGLIFGYGHGGYGFGMFDNGQMTLSQIDGSYVGSSLFITDTNWHHVAVTSSGGSVVFYVDGVAYPAAAYNPSYTFTTPAAIGVRGDNFDGSFLGTIDEVDIFNRVLASSEVQAIYNAAVAGKCNGSTPPSITTQPTNQTVFAGSSAIFSVVATGSQPLNYQWQFGGTNLDGAIGATLTVVNAQASNAGNYSVTITNAYGSITSSNASLTVNPSTCARPPAGLVGWWPGNGNTDDLVGGNNGTLHGSVTYVPGEVGQAFSFGGNDGSAISLSNNPAFQLQNFTFEAWVQRGSLTQASLDFNGGVFFGYGSGGYNFGMFDNGVPFLGNVGGGYVSAGFAIIDAGFHHLAVTKNGTNVVFYLDGVAYPAPAFNTSFSFGTTPAIGAIGGSFVNSFIGQIDEIAVYNRALFSAEIQAIYIAGGAGKCSSAPPFITTQPANQAVAAGNSATFSVVVAGTPPFNYQWQFDGTNLSGATGSAITLVNVQAVNAGNYSVTVTNVYGLATSSNATLTVHLPPSITTQPASQRVLAGNNATFSVVAAGDQPLGYQWQFNRANISGATSPSLTVTNVQLVSEGNYSVMVTNPYGSLSSSNAFLSVNLDGCIPAAAGLVSWWPGNGNTGDLVGGNNGTVQGTVTYGAGEVGQAFGFNGIAGGGVVMGNPANLRLQNFTIDAWIQRTSATQTSGSPGGGTVFGYGSGGYQLGLFNSGQLFLGQVDVGFVSSSAQVTDLNWHHVAVSKSGSTVVFYVDGTAYNATVSFNPVYSFTTSAAIGLLADRSSDTFQGLIDEVDVFNRALGATEIQAIYNGGGTGKCSSAPPFITTQPTNQAVTAGNSATFTVLVAGTSPFSYQWQFSGTNLSGATSSALTLANVQPANAGNYSVTVTNIYGSTTSSDATLTVHVPPSITTQPGSQTVLAGNNATFNVAAAGDPTLNYQWRFNGTTVNGATDTSFTVTNAQASNVGNYSVTITNLYGTVTSSNAALTVNSPPSISTQPASRSVVAGTSTTFAVVAAGTSPLKYQWQFNSINLSGATSSALTLGNVQPANAGNYSVTVTNAYGSVVSSNAALTVNIPPSITTQPVSQTVPAGSNATFSVVAAGDPTLGYQWRLNGTNISGATSTSLAVTNVQLASEGNYSVVVSNPFASITSSNAFLSVNLAGCSPPPAGLVSSWPGNGNPSDLAGGNNGTLHGSVSYVPGEVGQAFGLNGNGEGVLVGSATNLQLQNFTIEAWIHRTSTNQASFTAGGGVVFGFGSGGYQLGLFDNGQIFLVAVGNAYVGSSTNITDTNWHHVAVTKNGSAVVFYLDGVGYPAPAYNMVFQFTSPAAIGIGSQNLVNSFLGMIDEVDVFNRSLAASEVQAIYNAGGSGKCGAGSPPSITTQPANLNVAAGDTAQFSVGVSGSSPLSYQWQFNGTNLTDGGNISGSATTNLTVGDVSAADAGAYSVIVTNLFGMASSSNAVLSIIPTYKLSATTAGGGVVTPNPFLTQYPANSTVTLTATPAGGWTFLNWLDDAQGTNPSFNLLMNSTKKVVARFGTGLNTAIFGSGSITVIPSMALYPYGQSVRLVAQPQAGSYFVRWTNGAAGANNPLTLTMQNNNLTVGAVFAALTNGSNSLTVLTTGFGQTSATPPGKNVFTNGATVTLAATPNAGQTFLGWSGTVSATNNPLVVTMNQNQVITANFTVRPALTIQPTSDLQGVLLTLTGGPANAYSIQKSSDLVTWTNLQTVTNISGQSQLLDQFVTNNWFFYRALAQ